MLVECVLSGNLNCVGICCLIFAWMQCESNEGSFALWSRTWSWFENKDRNYLEMRPGRGNRLVVVNARRGDLPNQLQPNSKNYNIKILLQVHEKIRSRRRGSREEEKYNNGNSFFFFFSARHTNQINRCRGVLNWHEPAAAKWRGVWYRCLDDVATLRPSSPQRVW